jgi:hypothetical protein
LQRIPVTRGQMRHEWKHLQSKLTHRASEWLKSIKTNTRQISPSPIFRVVPGAVEAWEKRLV